MKDSRKVYLATFEFICGEYEQVFHTSFYAEDENDLKNKIHNYLVDYYGKGNTSEIDNDIYYYWNSEVAVKLGGWEEVLDLEQMVCKLAY